MHDSRLHHLFLRLRVKRTSALAGLSALTIILLLPAPALAQRPAGCTAPTLSVASSSTWLGNDTSEGTVGGKSYDPSLSSDARVFEAKFKARAADLSGLSVLGCVLGGSCGLDDVLDYLGTFWDFTHGSKGEVSRDILVQLQGPTGSQAQVRVESGLDGLLAVSSFGVLGYSKATMDADAQVHWGTSMRILVNQSRSDDAFSLTDLGVYFTRVTENATPQDLTLAPGGQLRVLGHLLAESESATYDAIALGFSQFSDPVGGGFFDALNPPISIPNPGLWVRVTIVNVSPTIGADSSVAYLHLGDAAFNSGTLCDGDGDQVQLSASVGTVVNNQNGTWSWTLPAGAPFPNTTVTITANDAKGGTAVTTFVIDPRVSIDLNPHTTKNVIDLRNDDGRVAVAVHSRENFDAVRDVEASSLRFGRTGSEDSLQRVGPTLKPACAAADTNDDGRADLVCNFHVSRMGFGCTDHFGYLQAGAPVFTGVMVRGADVVALRPCSTIQTPTVVHEGAPLWEGFGGVKVSPDGATLYVSSSNALFALPSGGGLPVQLNTGELGYAVGLAVSRDGATVFAALAHFGLAAANPVIVSVPAGGGPATILANLPAGSAPGGLAVTPDGTTLLIAIGSPPATLLSLPISGGTPINILSSAGVDSIADVAVATSGRTLYLGADGTDQILTVPATGGEPVIVPTGIDFADPVNIALSPDKTTLFVLDSRIRVDGSGRIVESGGWNSALFIGPVWGGPYSLLAVGGPDFSMEGKITVSPDGAFVYVGGTRRSTGAPVVLRVATGR